MTTEAIAPPPKLRFVDNDGNALVGGLLFTYAAGSTTKQASYTDSTGATPNANPIVLDSRGECSCWLDPTLPYKFTLAPASDTDPPASPIWSQDNVYGVQTLSSSTTEWVASGLTPTYIGATQFSVAGNQTTVLSVGRRVQASVTLGTIYGTITASAYSSVTTVTVSWDSGQLDSGLSSVSYGLLSAVNPSIPVAGFLQSQTYTAFTTSGTPPSYTLTPIPAITAYTAGQRFSVKFHAQNSGSDTISINSVTSAPALVYIDQTGTYAAVTAGMIPASLQSDVELVTTTQALVKAIAFGKMPNATVSGTVTTGGVVASGTVTANAVAVTTIAAASVTVTGTLTANAVAVTTVAAVNIAATGTITTDNVVLTTLAAASVTVTGTVTTNAISVTTVAAVNINATGTVTTATAVATNATVTNLTVNATVTAASVYATGDITAFSSEAVKENWRGLGDDFVARLALVKAGIYDRTDIKRPQVGVSMQSLKQLLPEAVVGEGVAYAHAALVACVKLAQEVVRLKEVISRKQPTQDN